MWRIARPDAIAVLYDEKAVKSLNRYFDVFQDRKRAKFLLSKKIKADFKEGDSDGELWREHERLTKEFYELEKEVDEKRVDLDKLPLAAPSYLDLKIEITKRIMKNCSFCERKCGIDRLAGEVGWCNCGPDMYVSSMFTHLGEEAVLVPSWTIFTMGCNLYCVHCQNWTISRWFERGELWNPEDLARIIDKARRDGNRNANLVGGEPTPWLWKWLQVFKHVKENMSVVWNSNTYYSEEVARLLAGFVDVYLNDFKYGNDGCATRISSAPRYWEVCTRNMLIAKQYGELLIRVLVLPGHIECCFRPIIQWIADNLGPMTRVNVMWQYRPEFEYHKIPELRRRLSREEKIATMKIVEEVGLLSVEPWQGSV